MVERKQINPAKCFYKTNSQGGRYKYCITNEKDYNKYGRLNNQEDRSKINRLALDKIEKKLDKDLEKVKDIRSQIKSKIRKRAKSKKDTVDSAPLLEERIREEIAELRKLKKETKDAKEKINITNKISSLKKKQKELEELLDN